MDDRDVGWIGERKYKFKWRCLEFAFLTSPEFISTHHYHTDDPLWRGEITVEKLLTMGPGTRGQSIGGGALRDGTSYAGPTSRPTTALYRMEQCCVNAGLDSRRTPIQLFSQSRPLVTKQASSRFIPFGASRISSKNRDNAQLPFTGDRGSSILMVSRSRPTCLSSPCILWARYGSLS